MQLFCLLLYLDLLRYGLSPKRPSRRGISFQVFLHVPLYGPVGFQGAFQRSRDRVLRPGFRSRRHKWLEVRFFSMKGKMIGEHTLQFRMEGGAVVGVTEVRQFVQENIVLQRDRDPHEVQVQVDVAPAFGI